MAYSQMLFLKRDIKYFIYNFNIQNLHSRCLQNLPEEKAGGNFGPNSSVASSSCFEVGKEEMPGSVVVVPVPMKQTKTWYIWKENKKIHFPRSIEESSRRLSKNF